MTLNMGVSAPSYPSTCNEFEGRLVCVHVCVCVCVCVYREDTNLYNDMGMTWVLQGEGDL